MDDLATIEVTSISVSAEKAVVTLANGDVFSFPALELPRDVYRGAELDTEAIDRLRELSRLYRARTLALQYISRCERSRQEVLRYLRRKGADDVSSQQAVERLVAVGAIDDERCAVMNVNAMLSSRDVGPMYVRKKLSEKGITAAIIGKVLREKLDSETEMRQAVNALRKKTRGQAVEKDMIPSLSRFLFSRGFTSRTVREALRTYGAGDDDTLVIDDCGDENESS